MFKFFKSKRETIPNSPNSPNTQVGSGNPSNPVARTSPANPVALLCIYEGCRNETRPSLGRSWYCESHACPEFECVYRRDWCSLHRDKLAVPNGFSSRLSRWTCTESGCGEKRLLAQDGTGWLCKQHKCPQPNCLYRRGWCTKHQGGLPQGHTERTTRICRCALGRHCDEHACPHPPCPHHRDQCAVHGGTGKVPNAKAAPYQANAQGRSSVLVLDERDWKPMQTTRDKKPPMDKKQAENQRMMRLYPHPCHWGTSCENTPISTEVWVCEEHIGSYDTNNPPGYIDKPRDESEAGAGPLVFPEQETKA